MATLIKLKGVVKNGKLEYDRKDIYEMVVAELEGQRFEEVIQKEHISKTEDQLGYYFGGIIKGTCMRSNVFAGKKWFEIDEELRFVTGHFHVLSWFEDGRLKTKKEVNHISGYSKEKMALFIEDVLLFLATLEIIPLTPEEYKYKQYTQ